MKNTWNGTPGWTTPLFTIYDKDWNIVDTCRTKHPEGGFASPYPISRAGDRIYLNQAFSDTIYVANNDRIDPALIIDFGQSDYPADIKYDVMKRFEFTKEHPDAASRRSLPDTQRLADNRGQGIPLPQFRTRTVLSGIRHEQWFLYILQDNGRGRGARSYVLHIRIPGRQGQGHLPVRQRGEFLNLRPLHPIVR